jgi:hypothetical protein
MVTPVDVRGEASANISSKKLTERYPVSEDLPLKPVSKAGVLLSESGSAFRIPSDGWSSSAE